MLNELAKEIHANAVAKGWWEEKRELPEVIALCHSELSEALEEYRKGASPSHTWAENGKPEGVPTEMIDTVIRVLDYLAYLDVDIDAVMRAKVDYNATRPFRHGGKVC